MPTPSLPQRTLIKLTTLGLLALLAACSGEDNAPAASPSSASAQSSTATTSSPAQPADRALALTDPHRGSHCSAAENAAFTLHCANIGYDVSGTLGQPLGGGHGLISPSLGPNPLGGVLGGGRLLSPDLGALESACAAAAHGIALDHCH